jgi:LacI family transcriptional regulator
MSGRRVTSTDVARAAGLSRTAVSLVLNGRADGMIDSVKQETVRRIAHELGYIPNAAAVNLRRQNTATIGLVTDEIASAAFAGELISGASDFAMQAGYMLLTIDTRRHADYVSDAIETMRSRDVDGLIYAAASVREVVLPDNASRLPVVLANALSPDNSIPGYIPNDRGGQSIATMLAIEAGHRRISFVTGATDALATGERVAGFFDAMHSRGLSVGPTDVVTASYSMRGGYQGALEVLGQEVRPTVLLCANDRAAAGAILAATSLGLSVPRDVSIIGFDDERGFAADVTPALTTVALPHRQIGEAAARHLLALIADDPEAPPTATVQIECTPVIRDSLASVPVEVRPARF